MHIRHCMRWVLGTILAVTPAIVAQASGPVGSLPHPKPDPAPDASCMSTDEFARRSLARHLGSLSVDNESLDAVVERLTTAGVPLSFIQRDDDAKNGVKVSFSLVRPTVQEVLERMTQLAPGYRYAEIEGHLLLFPSHSRWEMQLDNVHIGPGSRRQVAKELTRELEQRLPAFSDFGTFFIQTCHFALEDQVSVVGSGSVAELLAQLLGARPAAIFSVNRSSPTLSSTFLYLECVRYWDALLVAPSETVMHVGETIQLKVTGSPQDGTHQNVTTGACGTVYSISDTNVAEVSTDGLVTAKHTGEAWVGVTNAGYSLGAHIEVMAAPEPPIPPHSPQGAAGRSW
jgi:hypothetical protein